MSLDTLFKLMAEKKASDIYLSAGAPINIRINGMTVPIDQELLQSVHVVNLLASRLSEAQMRQLDEEGELNVAVSVMGVGRFRVSAFRQRGTIAAVIRYVPLNISKFNELGLPGMLKELALERRGLLLVAGAAGCGKSTTIASMLDYRNETTTGHILTLEDPIEYLFRNRRSVINQREIGSDALTMRVALKNAMRQAPDVIFIGEIRDSETMAAALAYALSGHLIVSTLHATNSAHALNRVISFYPPEARQALYQDLAASLVAVISQRLVRNRQGGRVPAVEMMRNTGYLTELIERGDIAAMKTAMTKSLAPGSVTFEQSLYTLLQKGDVAREEALATADSKTDLLWLVNNAGKTAAAAGQKKEPDPPSFTEIMLNI
jgi:twitching motility protein PilU